MRVCLASIHPRMLSGQIESLIALRDGLEQRGHQVQIISAFRSDQLRRGERWTLDTGDGLALAPKIVRIGSIVRRIAAAARSCDVLHFNVPTPAFGGLADLIQVVSGRPVVVGFEAHLADVRATASRLWAAPEFYGPRLVVNNGLVARLTLRRATRYVVSSQFQQRELLQIGYQGKQISIIPNLIDEHKLQRWDQAEARQLLGLPAGPLVAFVGHYHDVKGHDVLIGAFRGVLREVPEARLVLAWSGIGHQDRVHAAIAAAGIQDRVIELGRLDVGKLFSAADVVALPYRFTIGQAAFPGTVIEAMWVGVPLVTSNLPLLAELSGNGMTALLAEPGSPAQLANCITRLLREPELAGSLVTAQREAMTKQFGVEARIDDYVAVYREAISGQAQLLQPARRQR